jgi:hypothetical protein
MIDLTNKSDNPMVISFSYIVINELGENPNSEEVTPLVHRLIEEHDPKMGRHCREWMNKQVQSLVCIS